MNKEEYMLILNDLDDDLLEEARYARGKGRIGAVKKLIAAAACLALLLGAAFSVPNLMSGGRTEGVGGDGKINFSAPVKLIGEDLAVSGGEGKSFLEENLVTIKSSLEASGVECDGLRVEGNGYCHLRTGKEGNGVILNFRDYLLRGENGNIVCIATVVKESGRMSYSLAFGGDWTGYSAFLEENAGKRLAYLYIGELEAVLLPDGRLYYIGSGEYENLSEGPEASEKFRCGQNEYVP